MIVCLKEVIVDACKLIHDRKCDENLTKLNVLVTVGTTPFDRLIRYFDFDIEGITITYQISNGTYLPNHGEWFRSIPDFDTAIHSFDLIVTHAGAGSVYSFLEKNKKILVVPNTERRDKHQLELSRFVKRNNFACVFTIEELELMRVGDVLRYCRDFPNLPFVKDDFFYTRKIIEFFNSSAASI